MKGKSYSMPLGMVFKRYYCAKCGAKLDKERTHRVVTKDDKDYYQYHDYGKFPRRDYDAYSYRFKCPSCNARISYEEQCIISRIQKRQGYVLLSSAEIKGNYEESKKKTRKNTLAGSVFASVLLALSACAVYCFSNAEQSTYDLLTAVGLAAAIAIAGVIGTVRRFKGNYKTKRRRGYSYDETAQRERLHTYSSQNKRFILVSNKCYCFHCKAVMDPSEIEDYADNGQTAICPKCGVDAIIPDSIGEPVDETVINQMHEYWF